MDETARTKAVVLNEPMTATEELKPLVHGKSEILPSEKEDFSRRHQEDVLLYARMHEGAFPSSEVRIITFVVNFCKGKVGTRSRRANVQKLHTKQCCVPIH